MPSQQAAEKGVKSAHRGKATCKRAAGARCSGANGCNSNAVCVQLDGEFRSMEPLDAVHYQ